MIVRIMRFTLLMSAWLMALAVGPLAAQQNPIPEKFTNLKVLPPTITRAELVPVMRSFAMNLGVRCEHCHVGEGNDLSKFDFASDTKPAKATARRMLTMVMAVNQTLGVEAAAAASERKVTCFTCHRGAVKPLTAAAAGGGG
jgi:hypothetical protein